VAGSAALFGVVTAAVGRLGSDVAPASTAAAVLVSGASRAGAGRGRRSAGRPPDQRIRHQRGWSTPDTAAELGHVTLQSALALDTHPAGGCTPPPPQRPGPPAGFATPLAGSCTAFSRGGRPTGSLVAPFSAPTPPPSPPSRAAHLAEEGSRSRTTAGATGRAAHTGASRGAGWAAGLPPRMVPGRAESDARPGAHLDDDRPGRSDGPADRVVGRSLTEGSPRTEAPGSILTATAPNRRRGRATVTEATLSTGKAPPTRLSHRADGLFEPHWYTGYRDRGNGRPRVLRRDSAGRSDQAATRTVRRTAASGGPLRLPAGAPDNPGRPARDLSRGEPPPRVSHRSRTVGVAGQGAASWMAARTRAVMSSGIRGPLRWWAC